MDHVELDHFHYRDQQSAVDLSIAIANFGDMQIELIEQDNDSPSPNLDFLHRHGPGLQQYSVWSEDYDSQMSRLTGRGLRVLAAGQISNGPRMAYFEGGDDAQPVMEISDLTPTAATL